MQTIIHNTELYVPAFEKTFPLIIEFGYIPAEPSTGFEEYWGIENITDKEGHDVDIKAIWNVAENRKMDIVEEFLNSKRG